MGIGFMTRKPFSLSLVFFFAFVSYHFSSFRGAAAQVTKRLGPGCLFFLFGKRGWSWGVDVRENSEVKWEMHYRGKGKAGRTTHSRSFFLLVLRN